MLPPIAAQLRSTLQRAGHTDACIDDMTFEESLLQNNDVVRQVRWCVAHGCPRVHGTQFQRVIESSVAIDLTQDDADRGEGATR